MLKRTNWFLRFGRRFFVTGIAGCTAFLTPVKIYAISWAPVLEENDNVFPSVIISSATQSHYPSYRPYDGMIYIGTARDPGLMILSITTDAPGTFTFSVKADELMEPCSFDFTIATAHKDYQVLFGDVPWKFEALRRVHGPKPCVASYELRNSSGFHENKTATVLVHSINECFWGKALPMEAALPGMRLFRSYDENWAAYVNEDHPWVGKVLAKALNSGITRDFAGIQRKDDQDVVRQLEAIWFALEDMGIHYSSIATTSDNRQGIYSQHVRFLDETISTAQANCADGSIAFASICQKIGLKPILHRMPGHMIVIIDMPTVAADGKHGGIRLDVTMLNPTELQSESSAEIKRALAIHSFLLAAEAGWNEFEKTNDQFKAGKLEMGDFGFCNISDARSDGIIPVAYTPEQ